MSDEDVTVQDVYDSLSPEQKDCLHLIIGVSIENGYEDRATAAANDWYHSFSELQKRVTWYLVKEAIKAQEGPKT